MDFTSLGVHEELQEICFKLGWTTPTKIQQKAIPSAIQGKDIAGHAETGSGKTGAYLLPIFQRWLDSKQPKYFSLILTPTRELALQVEAQIRQFSDLASWNMICLTLIGGVSMVDQQCRIGLQQHHVCIGTPGRIVDHIETSNGFVRQLNQCRICVLDEADRMLSEHFSDAWLKIRKCIPRDAQRLQTMLFSATLSSKVEKMRKSSLHPENTVYAEASESRYALVEQLREYQLPTPFDKRELFLYHLVRTHLPSSLDKEHKSQTELTSNSDECGGIIIFCVTCAETERLSLYLRNLFIRAVALNGRMSESRRVKLLSKFARGERDVLVCTDVASRGLDIPNVRLVINFNVPDNVKDYQHRVGRTARAGRAGLAVTMVTHLEADTFQRIQRLLIADRRSASDADQTCEDEKADAIIPFLGENEDWRPSEWPKKYTVWCNEAIRLAVKELGEKRREHKLAKAADDNQEEILEEYAKIAKRSSTEAPQPKRQKR